MEFKIIYSTIAVFLGILLGFLLKLNTIAIILSAFAFLLVLFLLRKSVNIRVLLIIFILFFFSMTEYVLIDNSRSKFDRFEGEAIDVNLIILEEGNKNNSTSNYIAESIEVMGNSGASGLKEKIIVYDRSKSDFKPGDIIKARGSIESIIGKRNFGDNDIELYYNSKKIYKRFNSWDIEKIGESNNYKVLLIYNVRNKISSIINKALPKEEAAFLNAVIIGDKSYLGEEKDNYTKVGLAHILSISGLHVGFIVLLINQILVLFKMDNKIRDIVCTFLVTYYIIMIGAPPPALRSLIMMTVLIWGKHINREYDMEAAVSFAATIMLLHNPLMIHNQGFIISFACVYSIIYFYKPIYKLVGKAITISPIRKSIALSLSIQLGIAPILIYYFNYLSLASIFINIIAIPLMFLIIATGFTGVITSIIFPTVGIFVFSTTYYTINLLSKIVSIFASMPLLGFLVPSLPLWVYLLYYLLIVLILLKEESIYDFIKYNKRMIIISLTVLTIFIFSNSIFNKSLKLVFLDVGQGDSSLITTSKGKNILIDGGGSAMKGDYYYDVGAKLTVPALLKLGVFSIDTIIISHIHEDHLEGLIKVVESFKVRKAILPEAPYESVTSKTFLELCNKKNIEILYAKEGDKLYLDEKTMLEFIFPLKTLLQGTKSDENNNSIVVRLIYKDIKVLFTGDVEKEGERLLLEKDIKADILKVPHHGSNTSSSKEFIETVAPGISIISVGKNTFGHPTQEVIERLNNISKIVYRTDCSGAISLNLKDKKVIINTVR